MSFSIRIIIQSLLYDLDSLENDLDREISTATLYVLCKKITLLLMINHKKWVKTEMDEIL